MRYLLITNCTGRKSFPAHPNLKKSPKISKAQTLNIAADSWTKNVLAADTKLIASELYQGRTILDTKSVQNILSADTYVISAGLGLVNFKDKIPSYELTVNEASSFAANIKQFGHSNEDWWLQLNKSLKKTTSPLSRLLNKNNYKRVLISLPSSYLEMISKDLWSADPAKLKKVLIFTSTYGIQFIPDEWKHLALPYDERLEDRKSGYAGTRSDFPQRAMNHFVQEIGMQDATLPQIIHAIDSHLSKLKKPKPPERKRLSDAELTKILNKNWNKYIGKTSRLLRFLRDEALVSCEQSRFQRLCKKIQESKK